MFKHKKNTMVRSIRAKFTLWYIGSFGILLLITFGISEVLFQSFALKSIDNALHDNAKRLEQALVKCFPIEQYDEQGESLSECLDQAIHQLFFQDVVYVQLMTFPEHKETNPRILAKSYTLLDRVLPLSPNTYQSLRNQSPLFETVKRHVFEIEIRLLTVLIHDQDNRPYILQFAISTTEGKLYPSSMRHPLASRPHIFFIVFPILLVIATFWGYFFMKRAFAPVHRLVTLAKNITAEDLSHRIESVKSNDEIGELADTFNEMIARLERSFKQIQQFSGDVAHELKTPLTVIKGELEVALRKERKTEEYQKILMSLSEETEKLGTIVEDLLFLSRMDAHSIPLVFTELPLDELLLEVYEEICPLAKKRQVTFVLKNVEQITIKGDSGLLKRLFINLILNAITYTPEGGKIELSLETSAHVALLTISDTGIGIPEESLPYIFDRFYRVDQSRSHETGGSGLGLAIVHKIVEAHDGKIEVTSEIGKGATFKVLFNSKNPVIGKNKSE